MNLVFSYDVIDLTKNEEVVARDMRIFLKAKTKESAKVQGLKRAQENYPEVNGFKIINMEVWKS